MLIICDFDGTVTARDTNSELARRFAPEAAARVEGRLQRREATVREVLSEEFTEMAVDLDDVVGAALEIPFRAGFGRFLDVARDAGADVVLLSSGFEEVIVPMLAREGLVGRVPLIANSIAFGAEGGKITWRELPTCARCGEACKRVDVARLREQHSGDGPVVFVGDGFSDRCGADTADRIFARDSLATWLDEHGIAYERWDDFDDIARALDLGDGA